jgi:hypothetical protein
MRAEQTLDPGWPLTEAGLDSLMAVELRNAIASSAGVALPATLLFDYSTITALGGYLTPILLGQTPEQPGSKTQTVTADMMLADIEQLSDEDVDRLLHMRETPIQ